METVPLQHLYDNLFHASRLGDIQMLRDMHAHNIVSHTSPEMNTYVYNGRTALSIASEVGTHEFIRVLLSDPKVDVNAADADGSTPL